MDLQKEIERVIEGAIKEDVGSGDITSIACVPEHAIITGWFILKQAGVVAGWPILEQLFKKIDPNIKSELLVTEGFYNKSGTIIGKVSGPARGIMAGERIALNLLQHLSAVASITAAYMKKLKGLKCAILDTRKTLPGLRALEKYAVGVGGGVNHRFGLDDRYIIKNNHLYYMSGANPITEAVRRCKEQNKNIPIEIEIHDLHELEEALKTDAEAIMLSRMRPHDIARAVNKIRKTDKKVYVESLGTITLDTVRAYGETGVDGISIGSITHSVPALDIVMRIK